MRKALRAIVTVTSGFRFKNSSVMVRSREKEREDRNLLKPRVIFYGARKLKRELMSMTPETANRVKLICFVLFFVTEIIHYWTRDRR